DVGKPLRQGRADAVALARYLEFYAGAADKVHGETIPFAAGYTALTLREPHGVTGHIVPWNYPMQIVGRSVGAALAMGNACVLKPAEEACLSVLAFARIAREAGLPPGALNVVPGLGEEAGAALSAHPGVDHLSFTGSVATGALVQTAAAANAVPVTLELGGKRPQHGLVDGAPRGGYYVRPALIDDVPADHALAQEEIFGPVQVLIAFDGEAEAIRIANGTKYGLVAGVWTRDGGRQLRMARALRCGQVFINNYGAGGGIELPFGGVKHSGHGREKGFEALYGFSTLKTVAIHHG